MKVLILNSMTPFVCGDTDKLAEHLQRHLLLAGHEAEIVRIPFQSEPAIKIPSQILMCKKLELTNTDKVIALTFPAYTVRHPNKVIWLSHQYRQAYDLFDSGQTNLPSSALGERLRHIIHTSDHEAFCSAQKIFTHTQITQERLKQYNGFKSEVLLPPINDNDIDINWKNTIKKLLS